MKTLKQVLKLQILVTFISFGLFANQFSAHANAAYDIALTMSVSPVPAQISAGSNVALNFTLTNVGSNPLGPRGVTYVLLPPELTYSSFTSSIPGFECDYMMLGSGSEEFNPMYDEYSIILCLSPEDDFLPAIQPGTNLRFTVNANASDTISIGSSITGINLGNPQEVDYASVAALQEAPNYASLDWNNIASYVHSNAAPNSPSQVSSPPANAQGTANNRTQTSSNNSSSPNSTLGDGVGGQNAGSDLITQPENNDTSDQVEIAQELQDRFPERVVSQERGTLSALLSGEYNSLIGILLAIAFSFGVAFYTLRKRYLKRVGKDTDYRKALKVKRIDLQAKAEDPLTTISNKISQN